MPTISRFFDVVISMYYDDHSPPHFHIRYAEYLAKMNIESLEIQEGKTPRRVLAMVLEWAALHRNDLRENWQRTREGLPPNPIDPLEKTQRNGASKISQTPRGFQGVVGILQQ